MAEKAHPGPAPDAGCIREAVCLDTRKIFDSCRDKDCLEDLRFYPTQDVQELIDHASSIRAGKAELLDVSINVEPVGFNRGFYTVDVRYYYRVTAEACVGAARPVSISGLCVFDKRVILYGGERGAKVFTSAACGSPAMARCDVPTAMVEAVDPILLGVKLVDACEPRPCDCCDHRPGCCDCIEPRSGCCECCDCGCGDQHDEVPGCVSACFGCELCYKSGKKRLYVSLGQFSIIRLERDAQLLMPAYDYCMPEKECPCAGGGGEEDPCELFRQIKFPVEEFFPAGPSGGCGTCGGCGCH